MMCEICTFGKGEIIGKDIKIATSVKWRRVQKRQGCTSTLDPSGFIN